MPHNLKLEKVEEKEHGVLWSIGALFMILVILALIIGVAGVGFGGFIWIVRAIGGF